VGGLQTHAPDKAQQNNKVLLEWLAAARISPYISHVLPMQDIAAAYQLIVDRKVMGKVMITN
jgi:NADPH:quinone reductase-like Zn-dependent oxidoreductase